MRTLIVFALVGLGAQLVDGALGMAYGVTSSSLLLMAGVNPAATSASVHLAEVGTTLAAGASHWRFGNVDWKLVLRLGVPGAVGAFLGATALSALSTENAAPIMSGILLALGVYILLRFSIRPPREATARRSPHRSKFLSPLGLVAGFVDASGGGGWGPVATPALLTAGKTAPRTVIGSVDTSEFLVALFASIGFLIGLGSAVLDPWTIGGLLLGGLVAAPIAAWLVTKIPAPVLGTAVGGIIVFTNARTILRAVDLPGTVVAAVYVVIVAAWIAAVVVAVGRLRRARAAAAAQPDPVDLELAGAAAGGSTERLPSDSTPRPLPDED
ncbi:sulfite exporter TauE/SafE family protein [Pseudonocardia sp. RS010]|uniref:sulfite exporter TauE/SafE family protein n=1 Tax=Pseudonocardia sp. RS010 TaxID=3385979 RepID=UPI0039A2475E